MKDVFSIDRPGGDGQAQDSGGPGLVLHVCDMTEMKYAFLISPATTFFAALVLIFVSYSPKVQAYWLEYQLWALVMICLGLAVTTFIGYFFVKPIVVQRNGIYFPFRRHETIFFLLFPDARLVSYGEIEDMNRKEGLWLTLNDGKKYVIPSLVEDLDMVEDLIRKMMAPQKKPATTTPPANKAAT